MSFYSLPKADREKLVLRIHDALQSDIKAGGSKAFEKYFSDEDTYIRKAAYQNTGKIYSTNPILQKQILERLGALMQSESVKVRQTVVNSAGEIGIKNFEPVEEFFHRGLTDAHHSVRNAVIGSLKKMGEKNPKPVLKFSEKYLHHPGKEIRREICHGLELRGRTHPEEILPLLQELEFDETARVRNTLVHVLGQIAYKKGCLEKVIAHLKLWKNSELVKDALEEILDVHIRYKNFSFLTHSEAKKYIEKNFS